MPPVRRRIKNFVIYHAARAALGLIGLVPVCFVPLVGRAIGRLGHMVARRERVLVREQMALALSIARKERRLALLTRAVFLELGLSAVELARLLRSPDKMPRVTVSAASRLALDEALSEGRGVVFVTGHLGNWELMAVALASLGYPISTVARASYDARFTRFIEQARRRFGVEAIYRGDPGAPRAMVRALRKGRVLGFLIDQDTTVPSTFVPFFGRSASTPIGAALFATRIGAPSVLGSIRRAPDGTHHIDIERLLIPPDVTAATRLYTAHLESRIRRHPSQWVWFHRRWKTRPGSQAA